jgi:DNA transposition AAA+ family ATPase
MTDKKNEKEQLEWMDVEERIQRLNQRQILAVPKMQDFHKWLDMKRIARSSCRVIGESRTGKTVNCESYSSLNTEVSQNVGQPTTRPVLYWHCPEGLSVTGLFAGLLRLVNYQATKGRIPELRERTYQVLSGCQVEMIILDEAHRISLKALSEIRDISDLLQIAVVLVGTDRLNAVLGQDEQIQNRFFLSYQFTKLNADELKEMTAFWEQHVLQMPEPSKLNVARVQSLLLRSTRGYIGLLDKVLREAAIRALMSGQRSIGLDLLKEVIDNSVFITAL